MNEHPRPSALKDRSVIITGGASGIGLAATTRFAESGAYVTIADVQNVTGEKVAKDLSSRGHHVSFVYCDTADWESNAFAFQQAASFGPRRTLDVAILNAGIQGDAGNLADQVLAAPEPSLDFGVVPKRPERQGTAVNYLGVYDGCWLALHYMRLPAKAGPADIQKSLILTGSLASYADTPFATDYSASKFAVRGIFRSLRHTLGPLNVRMNLIAPYWINTPLVQSTLPILEKLGIKEGQGLTFVSVEFVVDAMIRSATDDSVGGKAWGIWPEGYSDVGDDEAGDWGAVHMKEHFVKQRAQGDVM